MHWHSIYSGPTTLELRQLLARKSEFYLTDDHETVLALLEEHIGYLLHVSEVKEKTGWSDNRAIRVMEEVAAIFQLPSEVVSSPHGRGEVYVWGKVIESGAWQVGVGQASSSSYSSVRGTATSTATAAPKPKPSPSPNLAPVRSSAPDDRTERVTQGNSAKRVALLDLAEKRPELSRTCALFDVLLDVRGLPVSETFVETWDGRLGALAGGFTRREAVAAAQACIDQGATKLDDVGTALMALMRDTATAMTSAV